MPIRCWRWSGDRPAEAYAELVRIFDPGDVVDQPFVRGWALADIAEAAVHGGSDLDLERGFLHDWQKIATATQAPHLDVQVAYTQALLADKASAPARFDLAVRREPKRRRSVSLVRSSPTASGCGGSDEARPRLSPPSVRWWRIGRPRELKSAREPRPRITEIR